MDVLGRKGCSRTALEYCKFVLSLCPEEDYFGVLLIIDYYALRSREYEYLLDFVGGWFLGEFYKEKPLPKVATASTGEDVKSASLLLLPNLLYSSALAKKMLNLSEVTNESQLTTDFAKVISIKNMNQIAKLSENALLMLAMIMYPKVLKRIIKKLKGPTASSWDQLLK